MADLMGDVDIVIAEVASVVNVVEDHSVPIFLKPETRIAWLDGVDYALTERQFSVVESLVAAKGGCVPGPELKQYVKSSERIDTLIKRLPSPIRDLIEAKTGVGYRLRISRA